MHVNAGHSVIAWSVLLSLFLVIPGCAPD
jgi:hypothetical protein